MITRAMARQFPPAPLPAPPAPGEPIRVGIVSSFYYSHSNWKIPIKGWMGQLDRSRFHVTGYHLGVIHDAQTDAAAGLCDTFVHRILDTEGWRRTILADAPHVLIYPGLLMDTSSLQLAAQRLAPVQCNSWGHPETSGLATLDYFLSSDLMEPPEAQAYYTEKLVRLPNLSIYYEPVAGEPVAVTREELGLRPGATVFWSAQSLYKYLPQYDDVFVRIARAAGNCQFVFLRHFGGAHVTRTDAQAARPRLCGGRPAGRRLLRVPRSHEPEQIRRGGRTFGCLPGQHRVVGLQFGIGESAASPADRDDSRRVYARPP